MNNKITCTAVYFKIGEIFSICGLSQQQIEQEETKKIKNLVQFTRLENNRHNHEVEFIGKHLEKVANTIRSKVTAYAEDANLDKSSTRQVNICDNTIFGTNYLQYLTSPRIEVSFRNDKRLLLMGYFLLCALRPPHTPHPTPILNF